MAYHLYYASFVRVFNIGDEDYDPENFPDFESEDYFLPDEVIEEFLLNYLEYSGDTTTTIEEITTEFNIHTAYLALSKIAIGLNYLDDLDIGDRIGVLSPTFYASMQKYQYKYCLSASSNEWAIWCCRLEDFPVGCLQVRRTTKAFRPPRSN